MYQVGVNTVSHHVVPGGGRGGGHLAVAVVHNVPATAVGCLQSSWLLVLAQGRHLLHHSQSPPIG